MREMSVKLTPIDLLSVKLTLSRVRPRRDDGHEGRVPVVRAMPEVEARALAHLELALPVQHDLLHRDLGVGFDLEGVLEPVDVGCRVAAWGAVALG